MARAPHRGGGFSLLEVLITILIVSVGLLGLAAMQAFSLKANQSASFRTQATALAELIVDRMRAHGGSATDIVVAYYGDGSDGRARQDLAEWRHAIATELPDGTGTLTVTTGQVAVRIDWTDQRWALGGSQQTTAFQLVTTL